MFVFVFVFVFAFVFVLEKRGKLFVKHFPDTKGSLRSAQEGGDKDQNTLIFVFLFLFVFLFVFAMKKEQVIN